VSDLQPQLVDLYRQRIANRAKRRLRSDAAVVKELDNAWRMLCSRIDELEAQQRTEEAAAAQRKLYR
jgi:hypothetical protein